MTNKDKENGLKNPKNTRGGIKKKIPPTSAKLSSFIIDIRKDRGGGSTTI